MIEPGELYKHFAVREIATGRTLHLNALDTRYTVTGPGWGDYRPDPDGDHFLTAAPVWSHPRSYPVRLDQVEPLPDGAGLRGAADLWQYELQLKVAYTGSWRQYADQAAGQ
jgi:hypothetical protein